MSQQAQYSVLFVCLGNICRSPMAEVVFRSALRQRGIEQAWSVDSCGTIGYHAGEYQDERGWKELNKHMSNLTTKDKVRSRQLCAADFANFQYILCMDESNLRDVQSRAPKDTKAVIRLFGDFDTNGHSIVEDPYYGGQKGFETNYHQLVRCTEGLLAHVYAAGTAGDSKGAGDGDA